MDKVKVQNVQQNLPQLLSQLKSLGFTTTIPQMQSVQSVLIVLAAEQDEVTIAKLTNYIAPIVCSSPQQQQNFRTYFPRFCAAITPVDEVVVEEDDVVLRDEPRPMRWRRWLAAAMFLVVTFLLHTWWNLPRTYLISGLVVDHNHSGIADIAVSVANKKLITRSNGYFATTLSTREREVKVLVDYGNGLVERNLELQREHHIKLDNIVLSRLEVSGKVSDDKGQALTNATLALAGKTLATDDSGRYQFSLYIADEKELKLGASCDGYFSVEKAITVSKPRQVYDIALKKIVRHDLTIKVSGEKEKSVTDARVTFQGQNVPFVDDAYRVQFAETLQRAILQVEHRDYQAWQEEIDLTTTRDIMVQLQSLVDHRLEGTVVDAGNETVANAKVEFLGQKTTTTAQGTFAFHFRTRQKQGYLQVQHNNYESYQQLVSINSESIRLKITLSQRSIAVYRFFSQLANKNYAAIITPPLPLWLWLVVVIVAVSAIERLWWQKFYYGNKRELQLANAKEQQRLEVKNPLPLFPQTIDIPQLQTLQQRRHVFSNKLDFSATAKATADAAGMFTPVYKSQRLAPEYLALVDRNAVQDHNAQWAQELLAHLQKNGIIVKIMYYNEDPRYCYDAAGQRGASLAQMAYQYYQHRLLIFGSSTGFFDPFRHEVYPWVERFCEWDIRSFFTPEPTSNWGYREWSLAKMDFVMFSTNSIGVEAFARLMAGEEVSSTDVVSWDAQLPMCLREDSESWIEERSPKPQEISELQEALREYLDDSGYRWLQRCAVYPQIHWKATLYLGHMRDDNATTLFSEKRLLRLMRLPWFRHSAMPQWLRTHLQQDLENEERQQVLDAIQHLQPLGDLYIKKDDITYRSHNLFHLRGENTPFAAHMSRALQPQLRKKLERYHQKTSFSFRDDQPLRAHKIIPRWREIFARKHCALEDSVRLQEIHRIPVVGHERKWKRLALAACILIVSIIAIAPLWRTSIPQGWESSLWELCWNAERGYIDFTVEEWGALSHGKQVELSRSYQEWYAQEKGLELTKEVARSGAKFVLKMIPPGKFWMGSPQGEKDREDNEVRHKVWVSEVYYVGETEVTQGQWSTVMGANPSIFKNVGLQGPVEQVSWEDCQEFCKKVGMRLLTQAEWEYACRAGTTRAYNLGDSIDSDKVNHNGKEYRRTETVVKSLPNKNSWGCYDFHGNVWEWCSDWYGDYSVAEQKDPKGSPQGSERVNRGGGWSYKAGDCRSAQRNNYGPDVCGSDLGLRLCVSGEKVK
ncbi:SUMF1/EgtB/PvdO family nonheme iron enzyme [Candidatus Uabimicrobium amorphum]|uniref:Sulfatase-modifying factor enzyme-like domain-containing protein n=1 Tax=Uabimicrobium amorphum TaxID=2596890 RepID=A0A5S9IRG9_UABAM|nr:SUMF1/EgtB/PvdO family nonheme iron enzyme [Candidatus Uabimicrobium amorphum]BBM86211.1 hypothetical protein UABAM_04597 [Candidatus Uabimicrobium amorphum]